jgi:hypothetical protein
VKRRAQFPSLGGQAAGDACATNYHWPALDVADSGFAGVSEAPVQYQHGENEHSIKAAVVNELFHALDRAQLRGDEGLNTHAHSH